MFSSEIILVLGAAILNFCFTSLWFLVVKRCHEGCSEEEKRNPCLLYTSPSPRDGLLSRMPSSA